MSLFYPISLSGIYLFMSPTKNTISTSIVFLSIINFHEFLSSHQLWEENVMQNKTSLILIKLYYSGWCWGTTRRPTRRHPACSGAASSVSGAIKLKTVEIIQKRGRGGVSARTQNIKSQSFINILDFLISLVYFSRGIKTYLVDW